MLTNFAILFATYRELIFLPKLVDTTVSVSQCILRNKRRSPYFSVLPSIPGETCKASCCLWRQLAWGDGSYVFQLFPSKQQTNLVARHSLYNCLFRSLISEFFFNFSLWNSYSESHWRIQILKSCSFQAIFFRAKPPFWGHFLIQDPPSGVKTLLGPLTKILDPPLWSRENPEGWAHG